VGRVEAVCRSAQRGVRKEPCASALFVADHGVEGDAHAGTGHRQVSVLTVEDIDGMRRQGLPGLEFGDFGENVVVSDLDLSALGLGSRLRLGSIVEISVTQLGKDCHARCAIYRKAGDCIMPRLGLFARVRRGGEVAPGDIAEISTVVSREVFQVVVLTISDRCSRGTTEDSAGPAVARRIEDAIGAHVYATEIVPDERETIAGRLRHYSDGHSIDLVVTVGGTGFAPRDVTPEAVSEVVERRTPGLDEAMRLASLRETPHAMLSRAVSGIRGSTLILALPGSERGGLENLEAVLPALPHGLAKLRGDPSDCGPARL
jgi:molybdenum cofactor synthesis domain-containing protein